MVGAKCGHREYLGRSLPPSSRQQPQWCTDSMVMSLLLHNNKQIIRATTKFMTCLWQYDKVLIFATFPHLCSQHSSDLCHVWYAYHAKQLHPLFVLFSILYHFSKFASKHCLLSSIPHPHFLFMGSLKIFSPFPPAKCLLH